MSGFEEANPVVSAEVSATENTKAKHIAFCNSFFILTF